MSHITNGYCTAGFRASCVSKKIWFSLSMSALSSLFPSIPVRQFRTRQLGWGAGQPRFSHKPVERPSDFDRELFRMLCLDSKSDGSILDPSTMSSASRLCLDSKSDGSILTQQHPSNVPTLCLDSKSDGSILVPVKSHATKLLCLDSKSDGSILEPRATWPSPWLCLDSKSDGSILVSC